MGALSDDAIARAAVEHIDAGRLDAAEELLSGRAASTRAAVLKARALLALKRGQPPLARELAGAVLAANDRDAEACALLSASYLAEDRPSEALDAGVRACALEPGNARHAMNLALCERASGRTDRAIARLEALAAADPEAADIAYNLGSAYLEANRPDRARRELERAVARDPRQVEAWANLAAAEQALGATEAALRAIDRALLLDPLSPLLLVTKASLASDAGDHDGAVALAERAAALQPGLAYPLLVQALCLLRRGTPSAGTGVLARAIRLEPENAQLALTIAASLRQEGKLRECLTALERAAQLAPGEVVVLRAQAEALLQLGRWREAFELWASSRPADHAVSLEGVTQLIVLCDPDPCVTVALVRFLADVAGRGIAIHLAGAGDQLEVVAQAAGVTHVLAADDDVPPGVPVAALRRLPQLLAAEPGWTGPYLARSSAGETAPRIGLCLAPPLDACASRQPRGPDAAALAAALATLGATLVPVDWRDGLGVLWGELASLDALVSTDGPAAHIAAAAGLPLVLLLDAAGAWAWPLDRPSPWYPEAEILRAGPTPPAAEVAALVVRALARR